SSGKIATSSSGGANDTAGVIFKPVSTVTQGFDDVITTFRTQTQEMVEEKNAAGVVTNVKPKEDGDKDN
ncbi:hypothetical protein, partial [Helicobacter sp. 11S02596-1]|uniref:hypothetical protein n=1 Tax=Helicobacter sp. 11S02596-1 TaxID=1476194 RepID=UPI0015DE5F0C